MSAGYDLGSLNSAYTTIQSEGPGGVGVYPNLAIQGYSVTAQSSTLFWNNDVWAVNGSMTKILGRHTIKAGANWRQTLWEAYGGPIQVTLNSTPYFTGVFGFRYEYGERSCLIPAGNSLEHQHHLRNKHAYLRAQLRVLCHGYLPGNAKAECYCRHTLGTAGRIL